MKNVGVKLCSWLAYHSGFWRFLLWLVSRIEGKPVVAVFAYHRVVPDPNRPEFLQGYERGLQLQEYNRQIEIISRYFEIIPLSRFQDIVTGKETVTQSKPLALLTYDDGDSENWTYAFPILWERKLPAVAYIPTGMVDTDQRFYHLRVTNVLNNLNGDGDVWKQAIEETKLPEKVKAVFERYRPNFAQYKYEIRRQLIAPLADLCPEERDAILEKWETIIDNKYTLNIHPMSWQQIQELPQTGIAIGSHTVSHNRFELLGAKQSEKELVESKQVLEAKLNQPIETICYPEGSFTQETLTLARKAGYKLGFGTKPELVDYPLSGNDLMKIGRIGAGLGADHSIFCPIGRMVLKRLLKRFHLAAIIVIPSLPVDSVNEIFSLTFLC